LVNGPLRVLGQQWWGLRRRIHPIQKDPCTFKFVLLWPREALRGSEKDREAEIPSHSLQRVSWQLSEQAVERLFAVFVADFPRQQHLQIERNPALRPESPIPDDGLKPPQQRGGERQILTGTRLALVRDVLTKEIGEGRELSL